MIPGEWGSFGGVYAVRWIKQNGKVAGRKECSGCPSQSVPHNVTSEMGLDLLDVLTWSESIRK